MEHKHKSVGAIIRDGQKFLLIDRVKPPLGWAGVAGHVDEGEEPIHALRREVVEESGFTVTDAKLVIEESVGWNECSRGFKGHYWYVYECNVSGSLEPEALEVKSASWYTRGELKHLTLEPVWHYWFKKLGEL
jgi:8-oxo-dGTP pyrophosphatase MutT (NUDIX family)